MSNISADAKELFEDLELGRFANVYLARVKFRGEEVDAICSYHPRGVKADGKVSVQPRPFAVILTDDMSKEITEFLSVAAPLIEPE